MDRIETLAAALPEGLQRRLCDVLEALKAREARLATAESCTGGLIGAAITDIDGLGSLLDCGFVTYSDAAKTRLLGVPEALLATDGAVSEAVARVMAREALERSGATVAVSVTGFAGPAGDDDEEGLVWFGLAREGRPVETVERHFGPIGRGAVRLACMETVVELLERAAS